VKPLRNSVVLFLVSLGVAGFLQTGALAQERLPTAPPDTPTPQQVPLKSFLRRWGAFYKADWKGIAPDSPAPARRGLPSPLSSPPFPNADWSYGGSPVLGEPDTNSYPLMAAINGARSRTKVYGWIEPSLNLSTSTHSNLPEANDVYSNRFELNQLVVYVERLPESVQREHVDIGYHLTAFYGTDYRFTTNKGYFSSQLIAHNRQYGFDPVLEYVDIYLPHVAKGMNIRAGRYISIPGIEAQLTPNNYMFSHSLLYAIDPFTDTGILTTVQLSDKWLIQAGITASHDVALWTRDAQPSATACVSHTTSSVNDNFYVCLNGINDGKYAYNNLQQYDATWYHRFSKSWHMATEAYVMYERDVPAVDGPLKPQPNTNGAACRNGEKKCFAPEYAFVNYINKQLSPHDFVSLRSDLLNDKKGQRTGIQTKYTENTLMLSHWIGSTVQIRPELRLDHAWDRKSYDRGTRQTQFTGACDFILHF
jgi:Putative beta-barrel porin-2, OmpL-like. bbp2